MGYVKQTWVDGESPINAERLNHIESGIAKAGQTVTVYIEETISSENLLQLINAMTVDAQDVVPVARMEYNDPEDISYTQTSVGYSITDVQQDIITVIFFFIGIKMVDGEQWLVEDAVYATYFPGQPYSTWEKDIVKIAKIYD